jgi:hypothetical protein
VLCALEKEIAKRKQKDAYFQSVTAGDGSSESSSDGSDNTINEIIDAAIASSYKRVSERRFILERTPYRKGNARKIFERDLQEEDNNDDTRPWLSEEEFMAKYRVKRGSFKIILAQIKDHPVFQTTGKKSNHRPRTSC